MRRKTDENRITLVERHIFKPSHESYTELDNLCFRAKNLYNATLYAVRQHFFETKQYLSYNAVNKQFTDSSQGDYIALPRKVSKMTQMLVDKSFKSFFGALQGKLKQGQNVKIPGYLDSVKGRQIVEYSAQALLHSKKGFIGLSGTSVYLPTSKAIRYARIVPCNGYIVIELAYDEQISYKTEGHTASIDLGVSNLATITSTGFAPTIINGRPLKSINQFYNKELARLKSKQDLSPNNRKTTNRITRFHNKRNNKVNDYMHKASRMVANHLAKQGISLLVIGKAKDWKQDVNIGDRNNQNFVQIPFEKFVLMLTYKCALFGIKVVRQDEAYSSKCSFLNGDDVCKHDRYGGYRMKRGLYKTYDGRKINADVNASANILRKYNKVVGIAYGDPIEVCSMPAVFTVNS